MKLIGKIAAVAVLLSLVACGGGGGSCMAGSCGDGACGSIGQPCCDDGIGCSGAFADCDNESDTCVVCGGRDDVTLHVRSDR